MSDMKTASYQVAATAEQCARWELAAEAEGHLSADTWLAAAADAYLKARATAGPSIALAWHRGPFKVLLLDGKEIEKHGMLSPPFGAYQGTTGQTSDGTMKRTLVWLPTGRIIATLKSAQDCKALAAKLVPVYGRDDAAAAEITERHRREAT